MKSSNNGFSFNLSVVDHAIVDGLRQALEIVMPEIMTDNNLTERNGYGQFRWNVIIAQLRGKCQHLGWMEFSICARGAWKTPVLFHPASRYIITFMTEDTFKVVQRRKDKERHYLCGAANFNQNVVPQYEQLKMNLPSISSDMEEWIARSQEQLAEAVQADVGDINGHVLVLFDVRADKLLSVRAVRLTHDLEISTEEEGWTAFIRIPYSANQEIEPQQNIEDDADELVELL